MTTQELRDEGFVPYSEVLRLRRWCAIAWVAGLVIGWFAG
jgi:hypothetical protein